MIIIRCCRVDSCVCVVIPAPSRRRVRVAWLVVLSTRSPSNHFFLADVFGRTARVLTVFSLQQGVLHFVLLPVFARFGPQAARSDRPPCLQRTASFSNSRQTPSDLGFHLTVRVQRCLHCTSARCCCMGSQESIQGRFPSWDNSVGAHLGAVVPPGSASSRPLWGTTTHAQCSLLLGCCSFLRAQL